MSFVLSSRVMLSTRPNRRKYFVMRLWWDERDSVLHCVAVCCIVLQCVAICCSVSLTRRTRHDSTQNATQLEIFQCVSSHWIDHTHWNVSWRETWLNSRRDSTRDISVCVMSMTHWKVSWRGRRDSTLDMTQLQTRFNTKYFNVCRLVESKTHTEKSRDARRDSTQDISVCVIKRVLCRVEIGAKDATYVSMSCSRCAWHFSGCSRIVNSRRDIRVDESQSLHLTFRWVASSRWVLLSLDATYVLSLVKSRRDIRVESRGV